MLNLSLPLSIMHKVLHLFGHLWIGMYINWDVQTGAATVENSMEFPQKTKNGNAF